MSEQEPIQPGEPPQQAAPPTSSKREPKEFPVALAAGAVAMLIFAAVIAYFVTRPGPPPPPKPTQEAYEYLAKLNITDIQMSAEENMLGHNVVMVDAKITNTGDRVVTMLRLRLYFYDYQGKLVVREEQDVITPAMLPLFAGETRDFQLRFDTLPPNWNVQPPQFQLVSLLLQE
jgi:hypothetical protein